jgi:hypothetical protein
MTLAIDLSRVHAAAVPACEEDGPDLAAESPPPVDARAVRAQSDSAVVQRVAGKLDAFVADMFSLIEAFQARTRDTQSGTQERDISARATSAGQAHARRTAELETAIVDRARAAESNLIGDICRVIGSIVSIAVGALGALFTGGASLVAAIAIVVAIVGPVVMNELAHAGAVDPEVAAGVSIGIAAVCTAVSLGCSVASLVGAASTAALVAIDAATQAAVETLNNVASIVSGVIDVTAGSAQVATATLDHDASGHEVNATEHGHRRDAERELQDQAMDLAIALFHSFARVSESMADCREESNRARRVALRAAG